jgi:dTDP-4-dehydrorhamnose reductase
MGPLQKPLAVTEVHLHCHREEQLRWFTYVWDACKKLIKKGVDIRGVTAWAVFGSFGCE